MNVHPDVSRLLDAGFDVLPLPSTSGGDDGLLFWRWTDRRTHLDVVATWGDAYAVTVRLPNGRDWAYPFTPTSGSRPGRWFAEVVDGLLQHAAPGEQAPGGNDFGLDDA